MKKLTLALAGALMIFAGSQSAMAAQKEPAALIIKVQHQGHHDRYARDHSGYRHERHDERQDRRELRREVERLEARIHEKRRLAHRVGPRQQRELRQEIKVLGQRLEQKQRQLYRMSR